MGLCTKICSLMLVIISLKSIYVESEVSTTIEIYYNLTNDVIYKTDDLIQTQPVSIPHIT